MVSGVFKAAGGLVDKAADLVPESVPRSTARAGVAVGGGLILFWLLQKVISGVVTLAVLGGLGYWFLTQQGPKDDAVDVDLEPPKGKRGSDQDDPLAEAKRIMDKYK